MKFLSVAPQNLLSAMMEVVEKGEYGISHVKGLALLLNSIMSCKSENIITNLSDIDAVVRKYAAVSAFRVIDNDSIPVKVALESQDAEIIDFIKNALEVDEDEFDE